MTARDDLDPAADERTAMLAAVFAETLGVPQVAPDESFFALGGHSLLATRLVARIRSRLGAEIPLQVVFESPTPASLAGRLTEAIGGNRPPLRRYDRPPQIPLAPTQRRLWFLNRLGDQGGTYNMPMAYRVRGPLDLVALRLAVGDLVARHESLRTAYPDWDGRPQQVVLAPEEAPVDVPVTDVAEERLAAALAAASAEVFDLTEQTPLRAQVFRVGPDDHVVLLVVHHIACDGWSLVPLTRDLAGFYAVRVGAADDLPDALPVQYADYALWQNELLAESDDDQAPVNRQTAFWRAELAGAPEIGLLAGMRERPLTPTHAGSDLVARIPADVHRAVLELARASGVSAFMVAHAALVALLAANGAGHDVVVGTPAAGRTDSALDDLVGFFVNTVVLRVRCADDPTFEELLGRVRATDLAAFAHQDVPFDHVVHAVNPPRFGGWQPLLTVMLAYQNYAGAGFDLPGLAVEPVPIPSSVARFDLRFELVEDFADDGTPRGIAVTLTWSHDVCTEERAASLLDEFVTTLAGAVARPRRRISRISADPAADDADVADEERATGSAALVLGSAPIAFVCSPYGQQWVGMARTALREEPVFRAALEEIDAALAPLTGWSLVDELLLDEPASRIGDVSVMQPVTFAVQVAIARWLEAHGVKPDAVVGHSLGEIAACVVAGILDVADAALLVRHYSAQQKRIAGRGGGMLVAEMSAAEMQAYLDERGGAVSIATSNGPRTTAIAGTSTELADILADLRSRDVLCAMIRVDLPAHTAAIDPVLPDLVAATRGITPQPARIPMVSTVFARPVQWDEVGAEYFASNLRRPVLLADATRHLLDEGCGALVEVSANPILEPALRQSVADAGARAAVVTTMRRDDPDDRAGLLRAAAAFATART